MLNLLLKLEIGIDHVLLNEYLFGKLALHICVTTVILLFLGLCGSFCGRHMLNLLAFRSQSLLTSQGYGVCVCMANVRFLPELHSILDRRLLCKGQPVLVRQVSMVLQLNKVSNHDYSSQNPEERRIVARIVRLKNSIWVEWY